MERIELQIAVKDQSDKHIYVFTIPVLTLTTIVEVYGNHKYTGTLKNYLGSMCI